MLHADVGGRATPEPSPPRHSALVHALTICSLLAVALLFRSVPLRSDHTWYDERYVFLEAMGIRHTDIWPSTFSREQVLAPPSAARALSLLAQQDAYPPAATLSMVALAGSANPLRSVRVLYIALSLLTLGLVYATLSAWGESDTAGAATAWAAVLPLLATTAQQAKWYTLATLGATGAGLALVLAIRGSARRRTQWWALYGTCVLLLLHSHYFGAWIVPAHGIFILLWHRTQLKPFVTVMTIVGALCLPWYALGYPQQRSYLQWYFAEFLGKRAPDTWYQPFRLESVAGSFSYLALSLLGLQPSPVRSRYLLPALAVAGAALAFGLRRRQGAAQDLARIGALCPAVAWIAQAAWSARMGHVTPLTAQYFVHWSPLLLATLASGLLLMPRGRVLVGLLLAASAFHAWRQSPPADADSLSGYDELSAALRSRAGPDTAIGYRSQLDAKMVNVAHRGAGLQVILGAGVPELPASVRRLLVVSGATTTPVAPPAGWRFRGAAWSGRDVRLDELVRQEPGGVGEPGTRTREP